MVFQLAADFTPTGDQPQAIANLVDGINQGERDQTLLGVTGSGKTFTMANVIQQTNLPTLIIAHNKTLAAQLYQEFRDFFPHNAVSYFVSYYDYYQPEAYIPTTDTYIEKEATINDEIDKLRLATTTNLLTRPDVIVVASVSCIYNLGSPVEYGRYLLEIMEGELISRETLMLQLSNLQYERSNDDLKRGSYRIRGDVIQLWPAYEDRALRIDTLENKITQIDWIDPTSGTVVAGPETDASAPAAPGGAQPTPRAKKVIIYPAKHYVVNPKTQAEAMGEIEHDLQVQVEHLKANGRVIEAYRLEQRVKYDLDMIREFGFVNGIENYSRYFDGRKPGDPPFSLLDYFLENAKQFSGGHFLTLIDESHITVPQIRGMYHGDQARKHNLVEYGFRLPSAIDNRPLQFSEFRQHTDQTIYVSATPSDWELSQSKQPIAEQLIRPTGLIDPPIELRPTQTQVEDLIVEIINRKARHERVLVTTLTKRMAEALTEYLNDEKKVRALLKQAVEKRLDQVEHADPNQPIYEEGKLPVDSMPIGRLDPGYYTWAQLDKGLTTGQVELPTVAYLHSDVETLERSDILADLRRGVYDVVVGINLLREGLDLPEVTLVAVLDADKEGFLRSATSLVQTMGRAARHSEGRAILYADNLTGSMQRAIGETQRRRAYQIEYNLKNQITPTTIFKPIRDRMVEKSAEDTETTTSTNQPKLVINLSKHEQIDLAQLDPDALTPAQRKQLAGKLRRRMKQAANDLDFELATLLRDQVKALESTATE